VTQPAISSQPASSQGVSSQADTTTVASSAPIVAPDVPVATSKLGAVGKVPGVTPKSKPFIALPTLPAAYGVHPSTLLLEHADPDSPVPLTDYAKQPEHSLSAFHLRAKLSAAELEQKLGPPAQLADNDDPWLVYRLDFKRELWLHFTGPAMEQLDAADVVRGAEDGYVRDRVFSADDAK
jgi:hypothetical protein